MPKRDDRYSQRGAAMTPLFKRYDFEKWDITEVPAYWLAEMAKVTRNPKYQAEINRRVAELHRQDELEDVRNKAAD